MTATGRPVKSGHVTLLTRFPIAEALAKGDKVELRNFGVFQVKVRKARVGRDPRKPEVDVTIPARATVKFTAGREMRNGVLKLTPKK